MFVCVQPFGHINICVCDGLYASTSYTVCVDIRRVNEVEPLLQLFVFVLFFSPEERMQMVASASRSTLSGSYLFFLGWRSQVLIC